MSLQPGYAELTVGKKNIFTDGTANGFSLTFGREGLNNIHVHGTFDGAIVTLERYSPTLSNWVATDLLWSAQAQYQGLDIARGQKYRLAISDAGASTDLIAELC